MVLIASYNIHKAVGADRRRRPERILEVLNEIGADIVILQEADRRFGERHSAIPFRMLAEQSAYRAVPFEMRQGSMGWHGNAMLVAPTIRIERHVPLHLPTLEPRGAVLVDLGLPEGRLRVVGMHLDLSGLWRRRQARAILDDLQQQPLGSLPTLLAGDLNEWGNGGCLRDFGQHHRAIPFGASFHARRPVGKLDRMFVSETIHVEDYGVHRSALARNASDHLPIWARIRIDPAAAG